MLKGVECDIGIHDRAMKWARPVLEQWLRVHRDYMEETGFSDSLYWYTERTNIGALAGAVWRCGGYAVEEYGALKGKDADESNGRVDLFFMLSDYEVVVEAKQCWIYLSKNNRRDFHLDISKAIEVALSDIRRTQDSLNHKYAIGIVFFPTYAKDLEESRESMGRFLDAIKSTDCSFYALLQNTSGDSLISVNDEHCDAIAMVGVRI